eukprot:CAMPEP_0197611692 /NCGR_PEP_ID=MMETSP1326-20131121/55863_1 /TAXON_ID=1155430 /ORGANISM="Genus nov. species nov., Strain RCC2288" /LENGTH=122 /DNA_ID=CAMNT_0043180361 /DNA_START=115 /DNA_END=479 /DNA_ORIENTATION=-
MAEEDELAAFQAELAEIEVEEEEEVLDAEEEEGERDLTGGASPEERRFEDDDGTWYVWDPSTRKFKPEGEDVAAAPVVPVPVWSEADMVFEDDAAPQLPSLKDAKKAVALAKDGGPGVPQDS